MDDKNENWFQELFIDEAKVALSRHSGGTCPGDQDSKTYINAEEVEY